MLWQKPSLLHQLVIWWVACHTPHRVLDNVLQATLKKRAERWRAEDSGTWKPEVNGPGSPGQYSVEPVPGFREAAGVDPCSLPSAGLAREVLARLRQSAGNSN